MTRKNVQRGWQQGAGTKVIMFPLMEKHHAILPSESSRPRRPNLANIC